MRSPKTLLEALTRPTCNFCARRSRNFIAKMKRESSSYDLPATVRLLLPYSKRDHHAFLPTFPPDGIVV